MYSMAVCRNTGSGNVSRRRSDVDTGDRHFFKLIEIPFSPFQNEFGDDDEFHLRSLGTRRRSCNYGSSRQEYLQSYTFSRNVKQTFQERMKSRLGTLKAAAWNAVACNSYNLPRRVRTVKENLASKFARQSLYSSQRSRGSSCGVPFLQPCFRA